MSNNPATQTTPDERTMATLAHALQIAGGFLAPLIIFFVRRNSKFVAFHALQALIYQLGFMVCWFCVMAIFMLVVFASITSHAGSSTGPPALFFLFPVMWLIMLAFMVLTWVLAIGYGIKAGRGEWAEYPVLGGWARRILKI